MVMEERECRRAHDERRDRRQRFIDRLTNRQRARRDFLTVDEVVATAARTGHQSAIELYAEMVLSIRSGEFKKEHRPMVLFLEPDPLTEIEVSDSAAATPKQLRDLRSPRYMLCYRLEGTILAHGEGFSPGSPLRNLLGCCSLPRDVARRWMERRGYDWPRRFDPEHPGTKRSTGSGRRQAAGTRPPQASVTVWVKAYVDCAKSEGRRVSEADMWLAMIAPRGLPNASRQQLRKAKQEVLPRSRGRPRGSPETLPK
jgi:hypothetical protein